MTAIVTLLAVLPLLAGSADWTTTPASTARLDLCEQRLAALEQSSSYATTMVNFHHKEIGTLQLKTLESRLADEKLRKEIAPIELLVSLGSLGGLIVAIRWGVVRMKRKADAPPAST